MAASPSIVAREGAEQLAASCGMSAAANELVVIADFDRTITSCFTPDGERGTSAHGVMESSGVLSEAFRERAKECFEKYFPIEIDKNISIAEKIPIMNEWYGTVHDLMLKDGNITTSAISASVAGCNTICLRPGFEDFLRACQESSPPIPVLIMSAGLGDVIEEYLEQRLPFRLAPSTMVVSNRMQFDEAGKLSGFSEPLLHMFNKTATFMPEDALKLAEGKKRCLLIGDGVGDLTMADGLNVDETLKVGFLNEQVEDKIQQYSELYDVVVTGDGPMPPACFRAIGAGE